MGFERLHLEPIVQRNLIEARNLRAAHLRDLLAWIKASTRGWTRSRVGTEHEVKLSGSVAAIR